SCPPRLSRESGNRCCQNQARRRGEVFTMDASSQVVSEREALSSLPLEGRAGVGVLRFLHIREPGPGSATRRGDTEKIEATTRKMPCELRRSLHPRRAIPPISP